MSWVKEALAGLHANQEVTVQPFGGSMRGRIESGQLVTLEPVDFHQLATDDAVFVKWGEKYLLHLVTAIREDQIEIGNSLGKVNGWVPASAVLGRVIAVRDEETTVGIFVEHCDGISCRVILDTGETVEAVASKRVIRRLVVIRSGDRLRIGGLWNQRYRILGFA